MSIIEAENLKKQFGKKVLFEDLSFQIKAGEMVAVTGKSGCGKTTLLNILGLIEPFDSGKVRIVGRPAPRPNSRAAQKMIRNELSYLFQNFALIDTETVEANLMLAASGTDRKKEIQNALRAVGLEHTRHQKVFELSGGEQQRIAIARTMLKRGKIVLADEPTGSLDPKNRDHVLKLLHDLCREGKTVLIVTHDPVVAKRCDRILPLA
ncbi:bacteriocin ABC transporter ATP-binding protein [Erysipelotrichaceae bacterium OPF54]|jgi:putative ABC transport system ATP-binding protein|uniref:ABC transporter ATP-binding protein n=1 Tax=uncultured Dubosiella sp. TaxID=1937011 RepID=UPI00208708D5|nr:ABC transporter ATP-binding protein [uncultured Dubosiella sp.]GJM58059.1 bacteriocin ABC transporter ATP-binding protein [Erysipelotrichaceae bacterium OPF54]